MIVRADDGMTPTTPSYREPDGSSSEDDDGPTVEEGLRSVLAILEPFSEDQTTRILLAVAALYELPVTKMVNTNE